jgi:AcrR family transcriptional regulator
VRRKPKDELRQARAQLYREHILEAAEKVFAARGFESARVQEISKLAGLSMGTIYSVFDSKEEIWNALLEERRQQLLDIARRVAGRGGPALEALQSLVEEYIGYFVDHPTFLQMHLNVGTSWVLRPRSENDAQARIWREIHEHQADIFRRGIADGTFVDEDPSFLAKMFSAMDQVVLADWAAAGMKADRDELVRRLKTMTERAFVRRA